MFALLKKTKTTKSKKTGSSTKKTTNKGKAVTKTNTKATKSTRRNSKTSTSTSTSNSKSSNNNSKSSNNSKKPLTEEEKTLERRRKRRERHDRIHKESNDFDEIIPNLWLGSEDAALSTSFVTEKKIKGVINCTPSVPNKFKVHGVHYTRVSLDDSLKIKDINKMTLYLPYIVQQLRNIHHKKKHKVLVHCHAGMQRSAIVVAAYLVQYYNKTPSEAIKYIISKRPIAFLNGDSINFEDSLNVFYNNLKSFNII